MADRFYNEAWVNAVIKAANVRHGTQNVLRAICAVRDYSSGRATFTKGQVYEMTGLHRETIMVALSALREKGVIVPLRNFAGGRGRATTYQIVNIGPPVAAVEGPAEFDQAEFSRIHRQDGFEAAMIAKRAHDQAERARIEGVG